MQRGRGVDVGRRKVRAWRPLLSVVAVVALAAGVPQVARAGVIVSLGDSYSSGEGNAPYDAGTDAKGSAHKCHRSSWAWPRLIGVTADRHLACSGAVVNNIPESGESGTAQNNAFPDNVVQITRLKQIAATEAISRVVLTIGGNDQPVRFASRLGSCWAVGPVGCLRDVDKIVGEMGGLRTHLANTYRNVQGASGGAPLLVVGYPDLFPAPTAKRVSLHCPWMNAAALRRAARLEASLDTTLAGAARDAGVDYLSMRDVSKGHELCTGSSWIRSIVGKPGDLAKDQQQGHPLHEAQTEMALRVLKWLNQHRAQCSSSSSVAAILDNSGSMDDNDPENIRAQAMRLLLTKPSNQGRTFGAVKFGTTAETLFAPAPVAPNQAAMVASLAGLDNLGDSTDYNAAFAKSAEDQPSAGARIFLTDGAHNEGEYENGHRGGPPTYVIGLNIGPAGTGDDADRLAQIAAETGGRYFPLRLSDSDTAQVQVARLQPALNDIDSRISCDPVQAERTATVDQPNRRAATVQTMFGGQPGMEVVLSWPNPDAKFSLASLTVRDRRGRVVGDLTGRKRIAYSRRKRTKIKLGVIDGQTFSTVTFKRPRLGTSLTVTVSASALPAPTPVTVQIRPINTPPSSPSQTVVNGTSLLTGNPGPTAQGTVSVQTDGSGTVTSSPAGIACPGTCSGSYAAGAIVVLSAAPASGWTFAGWSGPCSGTSTCTVTAGSAAATTVRATFDPPPPVRVDAYSNYGAATSGHAMCRGNPGQPTSTPGGTASQTFTVPANVASLDSALVQVDPDASVTAHLSVAVNGTLRATAAATAAGDTHFSFASVPVDQGDQVTLSVSFTATSGTIITVYSAAAVGGTLTVSNSCSAGATSLSTGFGLRATVSGWSP